MMKKRGIKIAILAAGILAGIFASDWASGWGSASFHGVVRAQQESKQQESKGSKELPKHPAPPVDGANLVVQLCDGKTFLEMKGIEPNARLTPEQAQSASDELMLMWLKTQPKEIADAWAREVAETQQRTPATKRSSDPKKDETGKPGATANEQPIDFSARDYAVWKKELDREVQYGNQIFHDDKLLGSTNGVSCAMCHPHGSNTHPETYPKFQVQLKRVALLRDMINWCIENPSRGPKLNADDPKMRALEAYILSQRKGVAMDPGKH